MPQDSSSPILLCLPQLTPGMGSWVWKWVRPRGCGDPCSGRRCRLPAAALLVHLGAVLAATAAPSRREGGRSRDWVCAAPSAPRTAASPRALAAQPSREEQCAPLRPLVCQPERGRGAARSILISSLSQPAQGGLLCLPGPCSKSEGCCKKPLANPRRAGCDSFSPVWIRD